MQHTPHNHRHEHAGHEHGHSHGHANDRGWAGLARYLTLLPRMWTSDVSTAVVGLVAPRHGERVLEIGPGMGAAMIVAARSGASYVGVEPTPYMRRILNLRRLVQRDRQRIAIVNGAAESLPVADGSVDAVWTVNTIHHWTDLERAAGEIHRVLRPGGRLLLVDEDFDDPAHPDYVEFRKKRSRHNHAFQVIDPVALASQFRRLGFTTADGSLEKIAGRPAKVVRGVRG